MDKIIKSNFNSDLRAANELACFLDKNFYPLFCRFHGNSISFRRTNDYDTDYKGADLLCTTKEGAVIPFDEKATLDYISKDRPLATFAFELGFLRNGKYVEGWLTNEDKLTEGYVLVWPYGRIGNEKGLQVELAEIMLIRRDSLISILNDRYGLSVDFLRDEAVRVVRDNEHDGVYYRDNYGRFTGRASGDGMIKFVHSVQKNERPLNVIIKKELLAKATKEVFWMKGGQRLVHIRSEKYFSPKSWSAVDAYFK